MSLNMYNLLFSLFQKEMKHNETMIPVDDIVFTALESRRAGQEVNKVKKRLFEPEVIKFKLIDMIKICWQYEHFVFQLISTGI